MEGRVVGGGFSGSGVTDLPRNLEMTYNLRAEGHPTL
jgi:hypothetical protein